MEEIKKLAEQLKLDFSMFKEWPISVWYDRMHPGMNLIEKFEDANHVSVSIFSLSRRYQNKASDKTSRSSSKVQVSDHEVKQRGKDGTSKGLSITSSGKPSSSKQRKKCQFIDDECEESGEGSATDEYDSLDE